jgi:uncharacterized membrane protein YphA (DoxX/SURF4 family)
MPIKVSQLANNKWLVFVSRLIVACVFILFAFSKLINLRQFASEIGNYHLLPHDSINILAIVLPGVEIVLGFSMLFGFFRRSANIAVLVFLIIFTGAYTTKLILTGNTTCGCGIEMGPALFYTRNIGLLILSYIVYKSPGIYEIGGLINDSNKRPIQPA